MKDISQYLREKYGSWGWIGQRAHDAAAIDKVLPLDLIICCDWGTETPDWFKGKEIYSIEKDSGIRKNWSNEDLRSVFRGGRWKKISASWKKNGSGINLLCYRSLSALEKKVLRIPARPRIFAVPERLKEYFDNKILLYNTLPELGIERIPGRVAGLAGVGFNDAAKEMSLPFVVQFPYGSSGLFTFVIRRKAELDRLKEKYPRSTVIVERFIDGFSANINAVIISGGDGAAVHASYPSVQIVGVPECSVSETSFCGNDYSASAGIDKKTMNRINAVTGKIGGWMAGKGYRGVFGIDFVIKAGRVYPVEINPRFQNSTSLYTALSLKMGAIAGPLFLLHIAEFLQAGDRVLRAYIRKFPYYRLRTAVKGAQLILHNLSKDRTVNKAFIPGVYNLKGDRLEFSHSGALLNACVRKDDLLVTCGMPRPGTLIEPGAPICKVQTYGSFLDRRDKKSLTGGCRKAVSGIYSGLALKDAGRSKRSGNDQGRYDNDK